MRKNLRSDRVRCVLTHGGRKVVALSLGLCVSLVIPYALPSVALGQGNGDGNNGGGTNSPNQLVITTATIDAGVIAITCQNLGNTAPDAFLGLPGGSIADLTSEVLVSPTELTASLPAGILPGNYLLVVRSGNGSTRVDSMDITLVPRLSDFDRLEGG